MEWRDEQFNNWLIQHFQRLREHQYKMTEKYEDAKNDIAEVVWVCKAMELESLLSYPHEHTTSCAKNCPLRHCDIFIVFGEDRTGFVPPRFKANRQAGKEIDSSSVAEYTGPYTETDTTDAEDAGPEDKRETSIPGENQSKQNSGTQPFEKSHERQEEGPGQGNGDMNKPKSTEINSDNRSETDRKEDNQRPNVSMENERPDNERRSAEAKLNRVIDQMWQEETEEEERLKSIEADENNKGKSAVTKSETQHSVAARAEHSPELKDEVDRGKSVAAESRENVGDAHTAELEKAPSSPKVKGPTPQKKKAKKKW
ncbi:hypothetical protein ACEPPN_018049 [Leptodophora sp. 'Broadleaf-Isolate-01']